ncbi:MAG TPA: alpha/beta fold hydrolase [Candidatus Limnocylindrales bacterium]
MAPLTTDGVGAAAWTAVGPAGAPAIVFVHGTRLTRAQWSAQMRLLAPRFRCIAVDLPGHGTLSHEPFTLDGSADLVAAAIGAEAADGRAVIVGLSLGGYVAIHTADRHPERVAGLVLCGCSAEPAGPGALPFLALAWVFERVPAATLDVANRWYFRLRYPRRLADPIVAGGFWGSGGAQALRALARARFLHRVAWLWTPVLVVNGALDPVFAPGGDTLAASCRSGRHALVGGAMHLVPLDRPRTFSRLVASFVDGVARAG